MTERDKPHLLIPTDPRSEPFTASGGGGGGDPVPFEGDRHAHGTRLKQELTVALDRTSDPASEENDNRKGTYVTFVAFPGFELALESLDPQTRGLQLELLAVGHEEIAHELVQMATVFIPDGQKGYFLKRLEAYIDSADENKAKNAKLVEGIQSIRRATVRQLWTDPQRLFPPNESNPYWWEVWLRDRDGRELDRLLAHSKAHSLRTGKHYLGFGDRTVILLRASATDLALAFGSLDDIAELRRPHDVASFLTQESAVEQTPWMNELLSRLRLADDDAPRVCVIDTGVQNTHPLLSGSLTTADTHVADSNWSTKPVCRHGTEMAGLALYGNLQEALTTHQTVTLQHRLESVKFLPDISDNEKDMYGAITARAVNRPEIEAASRPRVYMMAVTATGPERPEDIDTDLEGFEAGKPTSWSAAVDALASGRAIDDTDPKFTYLKREGTSHPRLFIVSAGNIRDLRPIDNPLERSDREPVEDPAQAWNALTVGAYTKLDDMSGAVPAFNGYTPLVPKGDLAPVSRTSVVFDPTKWPFKPDVVAEGGNVAISPDRTEIHTPENLAVLSTRMQELGIGPFTTTRDTSAATAQVAAIAADVMAYYPQLWPETIRALVVHSAEWTSTMLVKFDAASTKTEKVRLLRRYGMGVANRDRAIFSATDALTMIAQSTIHPYEREPSKSVGRAREMNLHTLPWPATELEALGETQVRMRITLSYFIEPNPSSRGWIGRYTYPSHALRFAVRRPAESVVDFRRRINTKARIEGDARLTTAGDSDNWMFGVNQQQSAGSLHTDIWTGPAVDLASKESIAIYPVAGWWKNRPSFDRSDAGVRYSLIVSIESPEVDVDLWTPVAQLVASMIAIET